MLLTIPREFYSSNVRAYTAWALFQLGRTEEAWAKIEEFSKEYPEDTQGGLAGVQALMLAATGESRKAEDKIKSAADKKAFGPFHHTAYFIACAHAQMNQPQPAIHWLQYAAESGFPCYPLFEQDPNLNLIRMNPGFITFMAKLKVQREHYKSTLFQ